MLNIEFNDWYFGQDTLAAILKGDVLPFYINKLL